MNIFNIVVIISFIVLYSAFIFLKTISIEIDIVSELILASVFFFALFSGFFITRQNDRYSKIVEVLAERDGLYSYLYRVFGMIPRLQDELREIIRKHYTKILNSNNWAYNEFHSSTTIIEITKSMSNLTFEEKAKIAGSSPFDGIWQQVYQLQQNRKKIIVLYSERLLSFQWILVYIFAGLTVFSFSFLQSDLVLISIIKIILAVAVSLVIIILKQLNDLSIFGKDFSKHIAKDVLRILDEIDVKELP